MLDKKEERTEKICLRNTIRVLMNDVCETAEGNCSIINILDIFTKYTDEDPSL